MPVYITAHRGMGITAKRRDFFIKDAEFYPENSIIAFREGIKAGADALECDIHVSKDHVAMVIHGNKITDYAYYIGDVGNKPFLPDGNKLCSSFNKQEIQTNFALRKKLVKADTENFNASEEISLWKDKLSQDPDTYKIPTLTELLFLVSQENQERQKRQQPPILLNIELKGKDSSFITLATLANFNKLQGKSSVIDAGSIVLLGKIDIGEIIVAKNLLKWSHDFVDSAVNNPELLKKLLGLEDFLVFQDNLAQDHFKTVKTTVKRQKQEYSYGKIKERIVKAHIDLCKGNNQDLHLSKNDSLGILKDFIAKNVIYSDFKKVRTNVMLFTGSLYGSYALSGNDDFDLKPGVNEISDEGFEIIQKCFTQGYDGIDISLFDFDHKTSRAVTEGIRLSNNNYPIVGVTASNWKGTVIESSTIKPFMAIQKAVKISQENSIDVLIKVDEPGLFKKLLKLVLNVEEKDLSTKLLATTIVDVEESEDEVLIKQDNLEKLSEAKQRWWDEVTQLKLSGYNVQFDARPDNLAPSIKPPRGERKTPRP